MEHDRTKLIRDIRQAIARAPVSVIFGSVTVSASKSKVNIFDNFSDAGLVINYEFSIRTIKSDFTSGLPKTGDVISIDNILYRVLKTDLSMLDTCLIIHCGEKVPITTTTPATTTPGA